MEYVRRFVAFLLDGASKVSSFDELAVMSRIGPGAWTHILPYLLIDGTRVTILYLIVHDWPITGRIFRVTEGRRSVFLSPSRKLVP